MDYNKISKEIRKKILKMFYQSQASHVSSSLSCVDILTTLYFKILNINPNDPLWVDRDRFILSKGHAAAALYAVLSQRGFFPENILDSYYKSGGKLAGHSSRHCVPGVEASTGSLGHGLSMGAGMAFAAKNDARNCRVFVLLSDGECQEGSTWEAGIFAGHHKLENLIGIVDYNKLQAFGRTNEILNLEPFQKKWENFGWEVKEIDGHNFSEIEGSCSETPFKKEKPGLVIAHTIKGKGISFMENKLEWHYFRLDEEKYKLALKELEK